MLSYVILQEDSTADNASLMGIGRQALLKAAFRPTQGCFRLCFMALDWCLGECKDKRGIDSITRVKRGYLYSAGGTCINPFLFLSTEKSLTQPLISKGVITTSFSTDVGGRRTHTDLW